MPSSRWSFGLPCAAKTYGDGTWYCALCGIGGDKDEAVEDYCKKVKSDAPQNGKPAKGK